MMDATDIEGLTQDREYHREQARIWKARASLYDYYAVKETELTLKSLWVEDMKRATQRYEMHCEKAGME